MLNDSLMIPLKGGWYDRGGWWWYVSPIFGLVGKGQTPEEAKENLVRQVVELDMLAGEDFKIKHMEEEKVLNSGVVEPYRNRLMKGPEEVGDEGE